MPCGPPALSDGTQFNFTSVGEQLVQTAEGRQYSVNVCGLSSWCSSSSARLFNVSACSVWNPDPVYFFSASLGNTLEWSYVTSAFPHFGARLVLTGGVNYYDDCPGFSASTVILFVCQKIPGDDIILINTNYVSNNCQTQFIVNSKAVCQRVEQERQQQAAAQVIQV